MDYKARCEVLEHENEMLKEEIERLKSEFTETEWIADPVLQLTEKEALLCQLLMKRGQATKEQIMHHLYQMRDEAEIKIVDVFVCKVRKKLKPFGIKIETIWGKGYAMAKPSVEILEEYDYRKMFKGEENEQHTT